jgi:hypothetical protein
MLGAFHGINPGMGWLFAVGLGLQDGSRKAVTQALLPIAMGHELSVALVVVLFGSAEAAGPGTVVRAAGAVVLIAFGVWKLARPNKHPRWASFRVNRRQLAGWSFLMSSAHGAGLMLVPVLAGLPAKGGSGHSDIVSAGLAAAPSYAGLAVLLHTGAMLVVMGAVALVVYEKVGLGILKKAWVNLDMVWAGALVAAGLATLFVA